MLFLCHSFSNKKLVDAVQRRLENNAYRCWRAPDVIPFGQHWCQNVVRAIHGSEAVVLLLTKEANASEHVEREVHLAMEKKKCIVPVLIGQFKLSEAMDYYLAGVQRISLPLSGPGSSSTSIATKVCRAVESVAPMRNESRGSKVNVVEEAPLVGRPSQGFDVNYMRLFGAIEVPFLMELIGTEPDFVSFDDSDSVPYYAIRNRGLVGVAMRPIVNFWKKRWRYSKARPLLSPLWQDLAGSKEEGKRLYWRALNGSKLDIVGYASHQTVDEDGENWSRVATSQNLKISHEALVQSAFTRSTDVGFLFAVFEHAGDFPANNVMLNIKCWDNPLVRDSRFLNPSPHIKRRKPLSAKKSALTPSMLKDRKPRDISLQIAKSNPGDTYIALLQVYRSDQDRLPAYYLADCFAAESWSWDDEHGFRNTQLIRPPYGKSAARVAIPNGWFGQ